LAGDLKLYRPIVLLRGRQNAMPMTWGFFRPKLLLPSEAESWSPQRRRIVLMHELAHIKRADFVVDTSHGLDPVRARIRDILAEAVKMPRRRS